MPAVKVMNAVTLATAAEAGSAQTQRTNHTLQLPPPHQRHTASTRQASACSPVATEEAETAAEAAEVTTAAEAEAVTDSEAEQAPSAQAARARCPRYDSPKTQ